MILFYVKALTHYNWNYQKDRLSPMHTKFYCKKIILQQFFCGRIFAGSVVYSVWGP